jgi:hypothetical protein
LHDLTLIKMFIARFVDAGISELDILTVMPNKHIAN